MPSMRTPRMFADPLVERVQRSDGTQILRSPQPLAPYARCVTEWLVHWANRAADRIFLAERQEGGWRSVSYAQAYAAVRSIGQGLLDRGLGGGVGEAKPLSILSDNSVDHALLSLAALHVGVPVVPISPAYSLMSKDFGKLKYIVDLIQPGLLWTADATKFAPALHALGAHSIDLSTLWATQASTAVDRAFAQVHAQTVAKILFTSGSTGMPKGVINTHGMLCANQQMLAQVWPFLDENPPLVVDWLPWNHTFGGNHNFNLILRNGGTLYIDAGKPMPGLVDITARNLSEIAPTLYFNVPRGFDLLLPFLERDAALRARFFSRLAVIFYAAAALPQSLWDRLHALARAEGREDVAMLSAWGSTETSPLATSVHFPIPRAGIIGLPVPGCELKLVQNASKQEVRVRGPHVTPGYYRRDDLTAAAFDEEGFYRIGDAVKLADPDDPARGLVFDGRVAEDFKLTTGTWVHVGALRVKLVAAADPLIQDAVITGHDRDEIGALVFLSPLANDLPPAERRARLSLALRSLADQGGSSTHPRRLLIMTEPPSIDENEITDKGYINQRAVIERRTACVERLYSQDPEIIL